MSDSRIRGEVTDFTQNSVVQVPGFKAPVHNKRHRISTSCRVLEFEEKKMNGLRVIAVSFGKEDRGQDVAEYCMITALIVLVAFAIFWHFSGGLQGMWTSAN